MFVLLFIVVFTLAFAAVEIYLLALLAAVGVGLIIGIARILLESRRHRRDAR